jgi:hypothetical protein
MTRMLGKKLSNAAIQILTNYMVLRSKLSRQSIYHYYYKITTAMLVCQLSYYSEAR